MPAHCPGHESRGEIVDEAIRAILSSVDMQVVLESTARLLRRFFGSTRLAILRRLDDPPGFAEVLLEDDPHGARREAGLRVALAGSASGEAVRTRRPAVVQDLSSEHPRFRDEAALAAEGYGTLVSFPLIFEDQVLGTLDIAHEPREGLLDCCFETAERLSGLVAIALHNSLMVGEVRRLNELLGRENTLLREQIRQARSEAHYVAESQAMRRVIEKVRLAAPSDATVLIRGETGTGKEGLARMIHESSRRFDGPYVIVNLGALAEGLIESELFGYEKGAFTGAIGPKAGRFEQADNGTIFLDEVGDAPLSVQVRLLRVLQEREVQRVGGGEVRKVDVRVVAATNRSLEEMVAQGTFRQDLYYRLNIFPLHLPPLRERPEDLRPLATYFLARQSARMHRKPPAVSEAAWQALEAHTWPGNVRELENFLERALILSPGAELVLPEAPGGAALRTPGVRSAATALMETSGSYDGAVREFLRRALESAGGRIYGRSGAAAALGLKPTTLQAKLKKYGLQGGRR